MIHNFTLENIDQLSAVEAGAGRWIIRFRSGNGGKHHQLYISRVLTDWTDTAAGRSFVLPHLGYPADIAVAAVDAAARSRDFSDLLPGEAGRQGYIVSHSQPRNTAIPRSTVLVVCMDHGDGVIDDVPLAGTEAWPAWAARFAMGEDRFGLGGLGYGGNGGPGLGRGSFAAGPFGIDADMIHINAAIPEEGCRRLELRAISPDGTFTATPLGEFMSMPPPRPARSLSVESYEPSTCTLTLRIE